MNRFRTGHGLRAADLYKWGLVSSGKCGHIGANLSTTLWGSTEMTRLEGPKSGGVLGEGMFLSPPGSRSGERCELPQ